MADQGTPEQETGVDPEEGKSNDGSITIKRFGREMTLTPEQAAAYASKGFDYEEKSKELKEERSQFTKQMEKDRQALQVGKDLQELARKNPTAAERILAIANGQDDPVVASRNGNGNAPTVDDDDLTETERAIKSRSESEVNTLRSEISQLKQSLQQLGGEMQTRAQREQQQQLTDSIRSEAKATGFWEEDEISEYVVPEVAAFLQAHPDASPQTAVWAKAEDHRKLVEARTRKISESAQRSARFRTEPVSAGTPTSPPSPYKDLKKEDMEKGKITEMALKELQTGNWSLDRLLKRK